MSSHNSFSDSQLDEPETFPIQPTVNVLKYILPARNLLETRSTYELYSPRCLFKKQLGALDKKCMPSANESSKSLENRLFSMQDAIFEFGQGRHRINESSELEVQQVENFQTLGEIYSRQEPYYSRFSLNSSKINFSSVYMNIGGVNVEPKSNKFGLPRVKSKSKHNKITGSLIFDSHFENGNLLYVFKQKNENLKQCMEVYDLILQNDVNTKGHNIWFNFKVTNTKKNLRVKFNIVNMTKKEALFCYGIKPMVFSQHVHKNQGVGWHRGGHKLIYQQNAIMRENKPSNYHTLRFQYEFREAYDTVHFTPYLPYTYSQLLYYLDGLLHNKSNQKILNVKKLCQTIGKNVINVVNIGCGEKEEENCKVVWIIARQGAVQSTSSFMIEAIVNYLLQIFSQKSVLKAQDYLFKIVPMLNPDGVIHGNSRCEITGIDSNKIWSKPSKNLTPHIYTLKKEILKSKPHMILDLHSDLSRPGTFFFANHNSMNGSYKAYPQLVCSTDERFAYKSCKFRGGDNGCLRKVMGKELNTSNVYSVYCSMLGFLKDNRIHEYKVTDYYQMGIHLIKKYFQLETSKHLQMKINQLDICDAQSAASQSQLQEQEYQQVYHFIKLRKNIKKTHNYKLKKNKERSNTLNNKKNQNQSVAINKSSTEIVDMRNQNGEELVPAQEVLKKCQNLQEQLKAFNDIANKKIYNKTKIRKMKMIQNDQSILEKTPLFTNSQIAKKNKNHLSQLQKIHSKENENQERSTLSKQGSKSNFSFLQRPRKTNLERKHLLFRN